MKFKDRRAAKTGDIIDFMLLKRVLRFAKPYKFYFIIASISAILLSVLGPSRPVLINYAIDNYIIIPEVNIIFNFLYFFTY